MLVLWRTPPQEVARTISLVLHCSQQIQKKYGRRDTDVGQKIQLKIGTGAVPDTAVWHSAMPQGASGLLGFWGRQLGMTPGALNTFSMSTRFVYF